MKRLLLFASMLLCHQAYAEPAGYSMSAPYPLASLVALRGFSPSQSPSSPFTILDAATYKHTVASSRLSVKQLLRDLTPYRQASLDVQIQKMVGPLLNKPYLPANAMGEGDWQPQSKRYQPGAAHIKQHPVYRLDAFDCQTFAQAIMAALHANSVSQFDQAYVDIAYGAARTKEGDFVRFYNRNHFVDADFNPINQQNGRLKDITSKGPLSTYAKTQTATITRQRWFSKQTDNMHDNVHVLSSTHGAAMAKRLQTLYRHLPFPHFKKEDIRISYLPKETLILTTENGTLIPNQALFDLITTPALVENIRDPKRWTILGKPIKDIIGSELTVSHMGILYRQTFHQGELIHYKTECQQQEARAHCQVTPVYCQQTTCRELMIAHATDNFPNHYRWGVGANGRPTCSPIPSSQKNPSTTCDRVITQPFFNYLTDKQFGIYWISMPSFLGVHIEQLL